MPIPGDRPALRLPHPARPPVVPRGPRADLQALILRERAHTLRLALCAAAAVLVVACLIPIANAGPPRGD